MIEELKKKTPRQLLQAHSSIIDALKERGIARSANNPAGDLGEFLFCKAYGWKRESNSNKVFDAIDEKTGCKYQIKARHFSKGNRSRQLSAIRDIEDKGFDFLAVVIFEEDWSLFRAALIPIEVVIPKCSFIKRTNSHKFVFNDDTMSMPGVMNALRKMRSVAY